MTQTNGGDAFPGQKDRRSRASTVHVLACNQFKNLPHKISLFFSEAYYMPDVSNFYFLQTNFSLYGLGEKEEIESRVFRRYFLSR